MKITKKILFSIAIVGFSTLLLSGCGKKSTTGKITPTPVPRVLELKDSEKPIISLIPRADGHEIKMKIENIANFVANIEYELLYTAQDNGLEMEKGVGDTLKIDSTSLERDLLLGTASCTNGCKYKYDTGINGGTLTLTLITKDGQAATIEVPFVLTDTATIKKNGGITFTADNYKLPLSGSLTGTDFYIMIKNNNKYTVFSSGAKNSLVGDHEINQ